MKLTHEQQVMLVQELARFETPSDAARSVGAAFGVTISPQQAWEYIPGNREALARKWRELFEAERARFIADVDSIAVNHKAYRMRQLEVAVRAAMASKRWGLAAQLLRQAAEESGGVLTNRRELTGANGGPLVTTYEPIVELPNNGRDGS